MHLGRSRDAHYRALADPVRRRLLRLLEEAAEPCDVEGLASSLELHPNTVRGHLDVLEGAGLVVRATRPRGGPGRPRVIYSAARRRSEEWEAGYQLLAQMLTWTLEQSADDPSAVAEKAGQEWGRQFARESADIVEMLDGLGFSPRPANEGPDGSAIELVDCPFRELAREHPNIVCSLHLGIMRGAAQALGGSVAVASLQPFVAPSVCRVEFDEGEAVSPPR